MNINYSTILNRGGGKAVKSQRAFATNKTPKSACFAGGTNTRCLRQSARICPLALRYVQEGFLKTYLMLVFLLVFTSVNAEELVTSNYLAEVKRNCREGNVSCENIDFVITNLESSEIKKIKGRTKHSLCADRITLCSFQGYQFTGNSLNYFLFANGELQITDTNGILVFSEKGLWQY